MYYEMKFNMMIIKGVKYKLPFTIWQYNVISNSTEELIKASSALVFNEMARFYNWEVTTINTLTNITPGLYVRDHTITKWTDGETVYKLPISIIVSDEDIENGKASDSVLYALAKYYKWERA